MAPLMQRTFPEGSSRAQLARIPTSCHRVSHCCSTGIAQSANSQETWKAGRRRWPSRAHVMHTQTLALNVVLEHFLPTPANCDD